MCDFYASVMRVPPQFYSPKLYNDANELQTTFSLAITKTNWQILETKFLNMQTVAITTLTKSIMANETDYMRVQLRKHWKAGGKKSNDDCDVIVASARILKI